MTFNTVNPLHPELWLLVDDPAAIGSPASRALSALPTQLECLPAAPESLLAWRLRHGRIRSLELAQLPGAVRQAIAEGTPAVHLHTSGSLDALENAVHDAALPEGAWRLLELHSWAEDDHSGTEQLQELQCSLLQALQRPDAWAEVTWRLSNGVSVPTLAVPDAPDSGRQYQTAFKAWRKGRFTLGDIGLLPGVDDDTNADTEASSDDDTSGRTVIHKQDEEQSRGRWNAEALPTRSALPPHLRGTTPLQTGKVRHYAASAASASGVAPAAVWFDIITLPTTARSPAGGPDRPCTLLLKRKSHSEGGPWLAVRLEVQWPAEHAENTRMHALRVGLLPRLQPPVLLTVAAGMSYVDIPPLQVPPARIKTWPQDLPGTPATVLLLPAA